MLGGCGKSLYDLWFHWTTLGVFIGLGSHWHPIHKAFFADDDERQPVQYMTGILLVGLGLNFGIIGTVFYQASSDFMRKRAAGAFMLRHFPNLVSMFQAPLKTMVGIWLAGLLVRFWIQLSKTAECLEDEVCDNFFLKGMLNVRKQVCIDTEDKKYKQLLYQLNEPIYLETVIRSLRESQYCLDLIYFVPFFGVLSLTTLISVFILKVHMMRQERLAGLKAKAMAVKPVNQTVSEGDDGTKAKKTRLEDGKPLVNGSSFKKAKISDSD